MLDVFYDLLSATLGAASGAIITAVSNRQKNQTLRNKIIVGQRELNKIKLENNRLLKLIEKRENQILAQEKKLAQQEKLRKKSRN